MLCFSNKVTLKQRITKVSKSNTKPNPPLNLSKLTNTSWKLKRTNCKEKEIKINILTPHIHVQRQMAKTRLIETRVTNADADHQDMVTDPSQNLHTKIDFSGDIVGVTNDLEGQMFPKVAPDKQTPDMVRRRVLSQALLSSIKSRRSAIGSVDSGSDMNPDVANIIDDTFN